VIDDTVTDNEINKLLLIEKHFVSYKKAIAKIVNIKKINFSLSWAYIGL